MATSFRLLVEAASHAEACLRAVKGPPGHGQAFTIIPDGAPEDFEAFLKGWVETSGGKLPPGASLELMVRKGRETGWAPYTRLDALQAIRRTPDMGPGVLQITPTSYVVVGWAA